MFVPHHRAALTGRNIEILLFSTGREIKDIASNGFHVESFDISSVAFVQDNLERLVVVFSSGDMNISATTLKI